jgi:hypothetical protein
LLQITVSGFNFFSDFKILFRFWKIVQFQNCSYFKKHQFQKISILILFRFKIVQFQICSIWKLFHLKNCSI